MKVLHVGPSVKGKGGIASVILSYQQSRSFFDSVDIESVASTVDRPSLVCFIKSLICFLFMRVDLVHIHVASRGSFYRKFVFYVLSRLLWRKVLVHLHGAEFHEFYADSGAGVRWCVRLMFSGADRVLVLSNSWKERVVEMLQLDESRVDILYNGVADGGLAERKLDDDGLRMVFLGRIGQRKVVYDLLSALSLVKKQIHGAKLIIGGDGDVDKLLNKVEELGLSDIVEYVGWVSGEQKQELLAWANVFVLPSYNEGFPVSVVEAMSNRLAVITTTAGGILDAIEPDKQGLVHEPGDVDQLSQYILELYESPSFIKKLGQQGRDKYVDNYSMEKICIKLNEIDRSI